MTQSNDFFATPISAGTPPPPPAFAAGGYVPLVPGTVASATPYAAVTRAATTATDDIVYAACAVVVLLASFLPWVRVKIQVSLPNFASSLPDATNQFSAAANQQLSQMSAALNRGTTASTNAWNAGHTAEIGVVLALIAGFLVLLGRPTQLASGSGHAATTGPFRVGNHVIMGVLALVAGIFVLDRLASLPSKSAFGVTEKASAGPGLYLALLAIAIMIGAAFVGASRRGELG